MRCTRRCEGPRRERARPGCSSGGRRIRPPIRSPGPADPPAAPLRRWRPRLGDACQALRALRGAGRRGRGRGAWRGLSDLAYGINESGSGPPIATYAARLSEIVARARRFAPSASSLLIGPGAWPRRRPDGALGRRPMTRQIIEAQRRVAIEQGCGFFDLLAFLGGEGSMARWVTLGRPRERRAAPLRPRLRIAAMAPRLDAPLAPRGPRRGSTRCGLGLRGAISLRGARGAPPRRGSAGRASAPCRAWSRRPRRPRRNPSSSRRSPRRGRRRP